MERSLSPWHVMDMLIILNFFVDSLDLHPNHCSPLKLHNLNPKWLIYPVEEGLDFEFRGRLALRS